MQRSTQFPDSSTVRSAAEALADKAHSGIDGLTSTVHDAVNRGTGTAATAVDSLAANGRQLLESGEKWMDATLGYVRERPVAALGVALAAGYLLSRILSSR